MAEIRVLDKHTAELIAAGEVVERPASVVKELVENAIDAGASSVEVEIAGGGIALIEIRDDGCGIEPEYMHNAFVRHATSKIACEDDLAAIHTLGFRGEALASVASVARVSMLSKPAAEETAWRYTIHGGEELSLQEDARADGTTITVRDLFYNTPARMKFLKKDSSEATFVQDVVENLALSHPGIAFRFVRDGKEQFFTPGDGRLASAAHALFPRDYARELLPVEYSESGMRISGLVAPPRAARASRSMQYFYVNGRYVKSRTMIAALENAFRGLLMGGRFPGCVLMLELPAGAVDVNVHPAKTEVRFARESDVFNVIYRGVKNAVMKADGLSGSLSLDSEKAAAKKQQPQGVQVSFSTLPLQETDDRSAAPKRPESAVQQPVKAAADPKPAAAPAITVPQPHPAAVKSRSIDSVFSPPEPDALEVADSGIDTPPARAEDLLRPSAPARGFTRNPFAGLDITVDEDDVPAVRPVKQEEKETPAVQQSADTGAQMPRDVSPEAETALPQTAPEESFVQQTKHTADVSSVSAAVPPGDDLTIVGEVFKTYILAQRGEELCFIDKHAAHERIIYEGLAAGYGSVAGQLLLMPVTVELSAEEKTALLAQQDYLENIGLSLDDFGGRSVLVREVPADIRVESVEDLVQEIAARLAAGQKEPLAEKTAWVLHSIACRAAIKGGDTTHYPEMLRLARDILDGSVPPFCPHGRPVILRITRKELEKQFGRLG
ncbi:MAG: DNA mismatch repair endonuclease MutL [Oscillospiraceae bacterium]|nr:DNA mismatch repair endonuclease MutL [Oscillospiraceae bacterium]